MTTSERIINYIKENSEKIDSFGFSLMALERAVGTLYIAEAILGNGTITSAVSEINTARQTVAVRENGINGKAITHAIKNKVRNEMTLVEKSGMSAFDLAVLTVTKLFMRDERLLKASENRSLRDTANTVREGLAVTVENSFEICGLPEFHVVVKELFEKVGSTPIRHNARLPRPQVINAINNKQRTSTYYRDVYNYARSIGLFQDCIDIEEYLTHVKG